MNKNIVIVNYIGFMPGHGRLKGSQMYNVLDASGEAVGFLKSTVSLRSMREQGFTVFPSDLNTFEALKEEGAFVCA